MFRKVAPNLIESDEGFSVEVLGRTGILYKEGDHSLDVFSEVLAHGSHEGIAVWRTSIRKWRPPHDHEAINEVSREVIIENIRQAIRFVCDDINVIG